MADSPMSSKRDLVAELKSVLQDEVLLRLGPDAKKDLGNESLANLLIVFWNWRDRFPAVQPRTAHLSPAVQAHNEHAADVVELVREIEAGTDLKPHLSKRIEAAYSKDDPKKPLKRRTDLDLLLADWGIHHLHLSSEIDSDGWAKRGKDLLFVCFARDDAYLIDVMDHQSWTELRLLEIIVHEWPNAGLIMGAMSGLRLVKGPTDQERKQLREAGVAQPVEIDGTVYMPRTQTTAGTAIDITQKVNGLFHGLDQLSHNPEAWLQQQSGGRGGGFWRATIRHDSCGFTNGRVFIPVVEL